MPFCEYEDSKIRFQSDDMQELHQQLCQMIGTDNLLSTDLPILCTIGSGFHVAATKALWGSFKNDQGDFDAGFLQSTLFDEICKGLLEPSLQFYKALRDTGCAVQFALPPQRCPDTSDIRVMQAVQAHSILRLQDLGCGIIDTRATTSLDGQQRDDFCKANDPIHGNEAFGAVILKQAGYFS